MIQDNLKSLQELLSELTEQLQKELDNRKKTNPTGVFATKRDPDKTFFPYIYKEVTDISTINNLEDYYEFKDNEYIKIPNIKNNTIQESKKYYKKTNEINSLIEIKDLSDFYKYYDLISYIDNERYLLIPYIINKPIIEVNLNSREIIFPSDFYSKQSIVLGDHWSNLILFSVDRFFDYMDINNTRIGIKWATKNNKGISEAVFKDTELVQGEEPKVIFGWFLTNNLTDEDSITFSISFIDSDDDFVNEKKNYVLNTLPQTLKISTTFKNFNIYDLKPKGPKMYKTFLPYLNFGIQPDLNISYSRNRKYYEYINSHFQEIYLKEPEKLLTQEEKDQNIYWEPNKYFIDNSMVKNN